MSRRPFKTLTLLNPGASPQTGVADGASAAGKTVTRTQTGTDRIEGGRTELVVIQVAGTWDSGTISPQVSLNYGVSPEEWTTAQHIANDGTLTDIAITADAVFELEIPSGVYFRLSLAGAGSPSLTARARGDIEAA